MLTKSSTKVATEFTCELCDYKTSRKNNYDKHILTTKHLNVTKCNTFDGKSCKKVAEKDYTCAICSKKYNSRVGLWRHKKSCLNEEKSDSSSDDFDGENFNIGGSELVKYLMKENAEFKGMLMKVLENGTIQNNNNTTNNNNNCHNKTFNLQVFLNEKCKDALNIDEFVDSLKISLSDIESLGENGFVNGVSKIFVNGLKSLDIYKRPIHCSDFKRETMYLREQNVWEKDNANNDRLKRVVKMIAHKNMLKVKDWKEKYPDYKDDTSKRNDQYLKILIGAAVPYKKEDEEQSINKIIRNIAKEVTIDKNCQD